MSSPGRPGRTRLGLPANLPTPSRDTGRPFPEAFDGSDEYQVGGLRAKWARWHTRFAGLHTCFAHMDTADRIYVQFVRRNGMRIGKTWRNSVDEFQGPFASPWSLAMPERSGEPLS
jgi:hypothetical protein